MFVGVGRVGGGGEFTPETFRSQVSGVGSGGRVGRWAMVRGEHASEMALDVKSLESEVSGFKTSDSKFLTSLGHIPGC